MQTIDTRDCGGLVIQAGGNWKEGLDNRMSTGRVIGDG